MRGPQGQKRPADIVGAAVMVAKIATGEIEEDVPPPQRRGGLKGGKARAEALTPAQRTDSARRAAEARWKK